MELAGARGALVAGGLIIAGSIGAGRLMRARRTAASVVLRPEEGGVPERTALGTAA